MRQVLRSKLKYCISTFSVWIGIKFDVRDPVRTKAQNFGDPLTFHLVPSLRLGQIILFNACTITYLLV